VPLPGTWLQGIVETAVSVNHREKLVVIQRARTQLSFDCRGKSLSRLFSGPMLVPRSKV
jgi:hypothetical protein